MLVFVVEEKSIYWGTAVPVGLGLSSNHIFSLQEFYANGQCKRYVYY